MFTQLGEVLDETSQWLFQLPRTGSEVRPSVVMLTCDMVDQHMAQQCAAEPRTAIDLHSVITCYHVHCTPSAWRGENRIHLWVRTSSHEDRRKPDSSRVKACVGPKGTSASLRQLRTVCASVLRLFQHSSKLYKKLVFKQSCICSRQLVAVTHPLLACGPFSAVPNCLDWLLRWLIVEKLTFTAVVGKHRIYRSPKRVHPPNIFTDEDNITFKLDLILEVTFQIPVMPSCILMWSEYNNLWGITFSIVA